MINLLRRFSTRENCILLLMLTALACLPISLGKIVRDATSSLLLPVTILAGLLAFVLASVNIKNTRAGFILIGGGPLMLLIRIAEIGTPLLVTIRETLNITGQVIVTSQGDTHSTLDFSGLISAGSLLASQASVFGHRLILWVAGSLQDKSMGDPAAQAFIWSLGVWLVAAWAGWHIRRQRTALEGLLPAAVLLGLILNNTAPRSGILWLFLAAFTLLLGITNYQSLVTPWKKQGIDFSDSIWEDSMIATLDLVFGLVLAAYIVSTFSLKEIIDRMRERQSVTTTSPVGPTSALVGSSPHFQVSLPDNLQITGGPNLSSDVVMTISTGDYPPMPHAIDLDIPHYYWRRMTYQIYTGSGWINPSSMDENIRPHRMLIQVTPPEYRIIHQVITFPPGVNEGLYWTGAFVQSDTPTQIAWRAQPLIDPAAAGFDPLSGGDLVGGLLSPQSADTSHNYTVESLLPNVNEANLRAAPTVYPAWVAQRYLPLPGTVPERVRALARDLTANSATPYDQALAIETYLRTYPYSLAVLAPPPDRDATDYFLFDLKKGYCNYYATAMTVLARAAGLPARLVTGYASGTYDPYTAQYVIRQNDAHAWTGIYFSGIGWIEFEPTANQPAPFRVVNHQTASQFAPVTQDQQTWEKIPPFLTRRFYFPWEPITALIFIFVAWIGSDSYRLSLHSPNEVIRRLFQRLCSHAQFITGHSSSTQTIREYTVILTGRLESLQSKDGLRNRLLLPVASQIKLLAELYMQSLFSPTPLTKTDTRHALQIWGRIWWRLFLMKFLVILKPISSMH